MYFDVYDILLTPFYIVALWLISKAIHLRYKNTSEDYKYFMPAALTVIFGSTAFTIFYEYYYDGGDSRNYYHTGRALLELMYYEPGFFTEVYMGKANANWGLYFYHEELTMPVYWSRDSYAFFVSKIISFLEIFSFRTYVPTGMLTGFIFFSGKWKLFRILAAEWPELRREMAICLFFFPSLVFWTSGMLKDTITLSAVCWYVFGFYNFFIKKKFKWQYIAALILAAYFLISIKPYVLFAVLPGSLIWLCVNLLAKYNSGGVKTFFTIALVILGGLGGYGFLTAIGDNLGTYSLDNVIDRAAVVQNDLKQSYYGGKTFDIGSYEKSVSGMLSVAHKAIFAGMFRPTLLDAKNLVMLLSAVENTFIMLFCAYLFIRLKFFKLFKLVGNNSMLLFCVLFSVFFSFSVGISISNFGSLVRLKTPSVPFFLASLFVLNHMYNKLRAKNLI